MVQPPQTDNISQCWGEECKGPHDKDVCYFHAAACLHASLDAEDIASSGEKAVCTHGVEAGHTDVKGSNPSV